MLTLQQSKEKDTKNVFHKKDGELKVVYARIVDHYTMDGMNLFSTTEFFNGVVDKHKEFLDHLECRYHVGNDMISVKDQHFLNLRTFINRF